MVFFSVPTYLYEVCTNTYFAHASRRARLETFAELKRPSPPSLHSSCHGVASSLMSRTWRGGKAGERGITAVQRLLFGLGGRDPKAPSQCGASRQDGDCMHVPDVPCMYCG